MVPIDTTARPLGRIYHVTAMKLLNALPANSVGAIVTDPPFIKLDSGTDDVSVMDEIVNWATPVAERVFAVLRPGGASVIMGGAQSLSGWEVAASRAGLKYMAEITVLWGTDKPRNRNFGSATTHVRWHIKPGARHVFNVDRRYIGSNVLVCDKVPMAKRHHPAQKPVELTNVLISLLTNEGDIIVDPFCGSGSTLVSAAMCDRPWLGADVDHEWCKVAVKRASQHELEAADLRPIYLWVNGKKFEVGE